ncbi:hypothetical protein CSOJ01_11671 [Colletotrichum sojae]|uniref:Uncharacterized protein n=1 Tax=Colletotrichum sojae TaxID=2175907 RepID=A0A8H6MNB9_9PEZI|nr:hypothetical protein CSOJ01_11671 [Colletotrichum sojae]
MGSCKLVVVVVVTALEGNDEQDEEEFGGDARERLPSVLSLVLAFSLIEDSSPIPPQIALRKHLRCGTPSPLIEAHAPIVFNTLTVLNASLRYAFTVSLNRSSSETVLSPLASVKPQTLASGTIVVGEAIWARESASTALICIPRGGHARSGHQRVEVAVGLVIGRTTISR